MEILTKNEYNQNIGKYKLLSSTAGVGSILTTKMGYYILVSDINKWKFVQKANAEAASIRAHNVGNDVVYAFTLSAIKRKGIIAIDDKRFISFINDVRGLGLNNLICLIEIPNISLNEVFNSPEWKNHPIAVSLRMNGDNPSAEEFMVMGTHFPKWFRNEKGVFKKYSEWKQLWINERLGPDRFVPPRDATSPLKEKDGRIKTITRKNQGQGQDSVFKIYRQLTQSDLVLICKNGHLSDIPWAKYLWYKRESPNDCDNLFSMDDCCPSPDLKWSESKNKSEGYGSVFIECLSCRTKYSLEGINNLKPLCIGEKPWEVDLNQDSSNYIPKENCCLGNSNIHTTMQVSLVTGNNVYYATTFSSLFIPPNLSSSLNDALRIGLQRLNDKYSKYLNAIQISRNEFLISRFSLDDFVIENNLDIGNRVEYEEILKKHFLSQDSEIEPVDFYEDYRWQEYQCFINNSSVTYDELNIGLKFNDIKLSVDLYNYFNKIQQIEDLKVTQIQTGFARVSPKERFVVNGSVKESTEGQDIFSVREDELFVLPANQTSGEGLFFQFNDLLIEEWYKLFKVNIDARYHRFFSNTPNLDSQGASFKQRIYSSGFKHFVIHTFSHLLMRELEFLCGYPTASLKERLYISHRMSGVLIYTADGSEGSMGGLVSQGETARIKELIYNALIRSINCSSDPLCWESDSQGVFDLNLSACFSCSLVSETACEEMNLGLDRRVLVDEDYGFFKDLIY